MTPKERAEKIFTKVLPRIVSDCIVFDFVVKQIEEAIAEERERCAMLLEGNVLLTADEFEGKTKLKVFDLLERIAKAIREQNAGGS